MFLESVVTKAALAVLAATAENTGFWESAVVLKFALTILALVGAGVGVVAMAFFNTRRKGNLFYIAGEKLTFAIVNIISGAWVELQTTIKQVTEDGKVTQEEYKLLLSEAVRIATSKLGKEVLSHYQKQLGTVAKPIEEIVGGIVAQVVNAKLGPLVPKGILSPTLPVVAVTARP